MSRATTSAEAHRIVDELDIRLLGARFADAAIRGDARAFSALWAPDCEWEITEPLPAKASGNADVTSIFVRLREGWGFFVQAAFNPIVSVRPDRLAARARFTVEEVAKTAAGDRSYHNLALYDDDLVRVDGCWRFKRRVYRYLWLSQKPLPGRVVAPINLGPLGDLEAAATAGGRQP